MFASLHIVTMLWLDYLWFMRKITLSFSLLVALSAIFCPAGQAQITIEGNFNDWDGLQMVNDPAGDHNYFDLLQTRVYSDSSFVSFQIHAAQDWQLNSEYGLTLYLDLDANAQTGQAYEGMGADLVWRFYDREGTWNGQTVAHHQIGMFSAPTVTSDRFEVSFDRNGPLQFGDSIRFAWVSMNGADDKLPDSGHIDHVLGGLLFPYAPIGLQKDPTHVRVMTYNVEHDGLVDPVLGPKIAQVVSQVAPDIITFNELWDTPAAQVKQILDTLMPLPVGWYTAKLFNGNVTASQFPITQSYQHDLEDRILVSTIDLPSSFATDLVVANLHLKCCNADDRRQEQVDGLVNFYRDLQTSGGQIDVPFGTAFVVMGDMNLVGDKQQLETILTGDIQDEATFGTDFLPDWDGSPIADPIPLQNTQRQSYTWPGQTSSYYPGRLDFVFYSDYALRAEKTFVVSTQLAYDASDHLPVVVDFAWNQISGQGEFRKPEVEILPNPASTNVTVRWPAKSVQYLELIDGQGRLIREFRISKRQTELTIELSNLASGTYYIKVNRQYGYRLIHQ